MGAIKQDNIQYDRYGRVRYHPEYHPNHGKPYTTYDLWYLCRFWGFDSCRSLSFALGRPETAVKSKVHLLKKAGSFEYYKKMNNYWESMDE